MIKEYKTQCLKARRSKRFRSRKAIFASLRKFIALSCVAGVVMISNLPLLDAYEAHVINVTAEVYKLDDPVFDPISMGFCIMEEGVDITSTDPDNGPVIVHYEVGTGTLDPDLVLDPDCDSSAGTGDPSAAHIDITEQDTIIKAVTCTADGLHKGRVVYEAYHFDPNLCPVVCGDCEGKISSLTLKYDGSQSGLIKVVQKKDGGVVFENTVEPNGQFSFIGTVNGTLSTEITIYVDDTENTRIHTSCSDLVGPNMAFGDFTIIAGESSGGGALCPVLGDVVLNEFLPNPEGYDNAAMPDGEWVELYNRGGADVDVAGWVIYDNDDSHELYITNSNTDTNDTVVSAGGWLVVYRNSDSDFNLNNDGDSVRLYDSYPVVDSNLIDEYTYTVEKAEGFSYARIPDGFDNWVDPVPTPGTSNQVEDLAVVNDNEGTSDDNSNEDFVIIAKDEEDIGDGTVDNADDDHEDDDIDDLKNEDNNTDVEDADDAEDGDSDNANGSTALRDNGASGDDGQEDDDNSDDVDDISDDTKGSTQENGVSGDDGSDDASSEAKDEDSVDDDNEEEISSDGDDVVDDDQDETDDNDEASSDDNSEDESDDANSEAKDEDSVDTDEEEISSDGDDVVDDQDETDDNDEASSDDNSEDENDNSNSEAKDEDLTDADEEDEEDNVLDNATVSTQENGANSETGADDNEDEIIIIKDEEDAGDGAVDNADDDQGDANSSDDVAEDEVSDDDTATGDQDNADDDEEASDDDSNLDESESETGAVGAEDIIDDISDDANDSTQEYGANSEEIEEIVDDMAVSGMNESSIDDDNDDSLQTENDEIVDGDASEELPITPDEGVSIDFNINL